LGIPFLFSILINALVLKVVEYILELKVYCIWQHRY